MPCGRNCAAIFVIGLLGAIPSLLSRATTPSYVAFVICFDRDDERRNNPEALRVDFRKALRCCGQKDSEMPHVENDRIVESTTEARAGVTGQNVNYVLLISTAAVIVLFAVAYLVVAYLV